MSLCSSCGAEIVWAVTSTSGKRIPLDAVPRADGNVSVDTSTVPPTATVHGGHAGMFDQDEPRYMPHHATCPDAAEWRTRKATKR